MRAELTNAELQGFIDGALATRRPARRWQEGANRKAAPHSEPLVSERRNLVRWVNRKGRQLLRPEAINLASRIAQCKQGQRCLSGACPECTSGLQRVMVEAGSSRRERLSERGTSFVAITLVGSGAKFRLSQCVMPDEPHPGLKAVEILLGRLERALASIPNAVIWGGIDLTYNVDTRGPGYLDEGERTFTNHWRPHIQIIMSKRQWRRVEKAFREEFPRRRLIPRPVVMKDLDLNPTSEAYLLKRLWERDYQGRRETYTKHRERKPFLETTTRQDRLQVEERLDQLIFLDRLGLNGRLVLANCELRQTRAGLRIKRIRAIPFQATCTRTA
jgi:hypothetical protein